MAPSKSSKTSKANKSVSVEMTQVSPKKAVVRFDTDADNAAMASAYVSNAAIEELGGAPNGVRITIEAL